MAQSHICRTLHLEGSLLRITAILTQEQFNSRSDLGRRICQEFRFFNPQGRPQLAGCLKALSQLETTKGLSLPAARRPAVKSTPRLLDKAVSLPKAVPPTLAKITDLEVMVVTDDNRPVWNTLIANEHPQGNTTFVGCQIRYLIGSAHGWLGAAGFSASAVRLTARDRWIAWSEEQRREQLHRVVGLSRFLIRPSVRCQHLASHVLGIILRRLPDDFKSQYDYRPLLVESFTDEGYEGTCLRAANFVCVGQTVGRGRQDRHKRFEKRLKRFTCTP